MSWKDNYNRKISIINARNGADISFLVDKKSFKISKHIDKNNSFSADSVSFSLGFNRDKNKNYNIDSKLNLKNSILQIPVLNGYNFKEPLFRDWDFSTDLFVIKNVSSDDLVKKDDELIIIDIINNSNTEIFRGKIDKEPKVNIKNETITIGVTGKDFSNDLINEQSKENIFYKGFYLCNNQNKDTSLLHQLAYKLGLTDQFIDFEDITFHDSKTNTDIFSTVELIKIEKGKQLFKEFAEACRSVDAKFHVKGNKLVVRNYLEQQPTTHTFDHTNVLESIGIETVDTDYSTVKINYDKVNTKAKDILWILLGNGGTPDDSNITLEANTTDKIGYKVDFRYSGIAESYDQPLVEVMKDDGITPIVWNDYDLKITDQGGTLHIWNSLSERVRIKKFIINGVGYAITKNNSTTYSTDDSKKQLDISGGWYIQNAISAYLKARNTWNYNCKLYKRLSFRTNINNSLEIGDVCLFSHFDYKEINKKVIIEKIDRDFTGFNIVCRQLFDADYTLNSENLNTTNLSSGDLNIIPHDVVRVNIDKPPTPVIKSVTSNVGGIEVELEDYPDRKNISTFTFELTMVDEHNTPVNPRVVLTFSYASLIVPISLGLSIYWNKRWQVRAKAYSLQGEESELSIVTSKCFAKSLQIDSNGIGPQTITAAMFKFTNNDAMYVDPQGFLRIKANGVLIGQDPITDTFNDVNQKVGANTSGISSNKNNISTNTVNVGNAQSKADLAKTKAEEVASKLANGEIVLNNHTDIYGQLEVFGGQRGITSYNGTTEANSTKKIVITGGEIAFYERSSP